MSLNITHLFPDEFTKKLINFPKETLINLFILAEEAINLFLNGELSALDPLVCENACHIRAFALWKMAQKYREKQNNLILHSARASLNNIVNKIGELPPINERAEQTISEYLQQNGLYLELNTTILADLKFLFLSYLLTLTKKLLPSSSFMLHEKTCTMALKKTGLVLNKIKSLVSSAQKELSSMSCRFIQNQNELYGNDALTQLLVTRYDDHQRSYLPQYATAKAILLNALQSNTPLIIKVSRFLKKNYHDELALICIPLPNKKDFHITHHVNNDSDAALIFEGIINYPEKVESAEHYAHQLNQHSLLQILLANFAAHPQFSGNLRATQCIYKELLNKAGELKSHIAQEWKEYNHHAYIAQKEGCSLENPSLLLLNHVFCDSISYYVSTHKMPMLSLQTLSDETKL